MAKPQRNLSTLWQLLPFLAPYKKRVVVFLIALILTSATMLAIGQGVRLLIDEGFIQQSSTELNRATLIILGLAAFMAVGTFVRFYLISWLGERISADIRRKVFEQIISLHPSFFESNRSGEIMSRLTTDTTLLQSIIGSSFSVALRSSISFAGGLVMLAITNTKLTLIIMLGVPLVLLPMLLFGQRVKKLSRQSQDSIADVGSYAGEIIQNIKTVQSFTREPHEQNAFATEVERAFAIARQRVKQRGLLISGVILLVFTSLTGLMWVGGNDVLEGRMSGGDLGAFVFYAILVAGAVGSLSEVYGELLRASGATERLVELMQEKSNLVEVDKAEPAAQFDPELHLQDIRFAYPSHPEIEVLRGVNLQFPKGKVTALVGPSGSGKSTLFELLQRFYDPLEGEILLGNASYQQNLKSLALSDLRAQIGVVAQSPHLFTGTVMDNIRYGDLAASDEQVFAAARAANAEEFILELPGGYNSHLGEQGVRLSGGQRQRIAIARALLKNPRILLLDEATSALDAESEAKVQAALETLMQGRTTVIIAHRLSTVIHADNIIVLESGVVVDQGSHTQLIKHSALYQRLAKLQFQSAEVKEP